MLEHIENWKLAVKTIKESCKMDGLIILSTRGPGMGYHGYPFDYWRFTKQDIERIFRDYKILNLIEDWQLPGVIMMGRKFGFTTDEYDDIFLQSAPPPPSFFKRKWDDLGNLKNAILQFLGR
jgi:hypothetical protein